MYPEEKEDVGGSHGAYASVLPEELVVGSIKIVGYPSRPMNVVRPFEWSSATPHPTRPPAVPFETIVRLARCLYVMGQL